MKKLSITLFLTILILSLHSFAHAYEAKVVGVADGDTITVLNNNNQSVKIRLYGIDCPEKAQDFGNKAKQFVSEKTFGKLINVIPIDQDRYGRTVGIITLPDGSNLNEQILKAGYAWVYTQYCSLPFCSDWIKIQSTAQNARLGLWSQSNPVPPWEYRNGKKTASSSINKPTGQSGTSSYHGNRKSHIFHDAGCRYFDCKNCTVVFKNREAAVKSGYRPCKICKP